MRRQGKTSRGEGQQTRNHGPKQEHGDICPRISRELLRSAYDKGAIALPSNRNAASRMLSSLAGPTFELGQQMINKVSESHTSLSQSDASSVSPVFQFRTLAGLRHLGELIQVAGLSGPKSEDSRRRKTT